MKTFVTFRLFWFVVFVISSLSLAAIAQDITSKNWGKSSQGIKLSLREGPRQRSANGTILSYNVIGEGFPSDMPYQLWQWTPGQEPQVAMEGVSFDKRGVLVCSGKPGFCSGDGPDDPINIRTTAVLGEAKDLAVVSPDGKIAGFARAVPFPIEASDKKCTLSVVRYSPLADVVTARATGFTPSEKLKVTTRWSSEGATTENDAGTDGSWSGVVLADAKTQKAGTAQISVAGQACTVSVKFPWGAGSNHPM